MSRRGSAGTRGHLMMEAMVGGVVLLMAIGAISSALLASSSSIAEANRLQQAQHEAMERLEWMRVQPLSAPAWAVTGTPITGTVPNNPSWTWEILVTSVNDTNVGGPVSGPLTYRKATITVFYDPNDNTRNLRLETYKW